MKLLQFLADLWLRLIGPVEDDNYDDQEYSN